MAYLPSYLFDDDRVLVVADAKDREKMLKFYPGLEDTPWYLVQDVRIDHVRGQSVYTRGLAACEIPGFVYNVAKAVYSVY